MVMAITNMAILLIPPIVCCLVMQVLMVIWCLCPNCFGRLLESQQERVEMELHSRPNRHASDDLISQCSTLSTYVEPKEGIALEEGQISKSDAICAICLSEYQTGEKLRILNACQHHFHSDCVAKWLSMEKSCPLCKKDIDFVQQALEEEQKEEV